MKKINILKAIVDYLWIVTVPIGALLIIAFIPGIFFIDFNENNIEFLDFSIEENVYSKLLLAIKAATYLLILYAFHLFRNILRFFQRVKIFDPKVIASFTQIGTFLIIAGIVSFVVSIIMRVYFKGSISITFGFNNDIVLVGLGLFFQILAEVFKIAKAAKEENELTI
jgi:hypothetical protein